MGIRDAKAHHGQRIFDTLERTTEQGIRNSSARLLPEGTVCLSRTASVGYVAIMGKPMATSQDFVNWVCSDALEPRFLQYLLLAEQESLSRFSSGAVHQTIYYPEVKAFHVCLPPLGEQQRIVGILDEVFDGIATATSNAQRNLASARELFSGEVNQLFEASGVDWDWPPVGEVADTRLGKMLDKRKNRGSPKPYLRNLNVRWFEIDLTDLLEMRFEESELERYTVHRGDLLIVEGGYPGRAAVWNGEEPMHFQKAVHRVRFDDPRLAKLLMYYLFTSNIDGSLAGNFTGTGIQHFTGQALKRFKTPVPLAEERDALIQRIEEFHTLSCQLQASYVSKLDLLAQLKQSILRCAFTGDLASRTVVREVTTSPPANNNFSTPEFVASVVAVAFRQHAAQSREKTFGHVKAQKALHLCESIGGLDLGRQPMRDAAGPNDFQHMLQAEKWAKQQGFFKFAKRHTGGYEFRKLQNFEAMIEEAVARVKPVEDSITRAIDPIISMSTDDAEVFATVHAAWNNLILDRAVVTDDAIIRASRDDWHPDKLRIPESKFRMAIRLIRKKGLVPDGSAKRVRGQERLL